MRKNTLSRKIFIFLMVIYPVVHYLVFTIYINFSTIMYSFRRWNSYTGNIDFVGFENYTKMFEIIMKEHSYNKALVNTLLWVPVTLLGLIPISIVVAYILSKQIRFRRFYRAVYFFPSIISIVIITMVFSFMVNPNIGVINRFLESIGLEQFKRSWLGDTKTALPTVFFFCIWAGIGFNNVVITGAIDRIPKDIFEVGKTFGITPLKELFYVVIPLIWQTISTLVIINTSASFVVFLQPKLLTNGGPNFSTNTVALQIVEMVKTGDYGMASTFGIFLAVIGFIITRLVKTFMDRVEAVEY